MKKITWGQPTFYIYKGHETSQPGKEHVENLISVAKRTKTKTIYPKPFWYTLSQFCKLHSLTFIFQ